MIENVQSGLCSVTFRGLDPAAIIDLAVGAGLQGIEWGADGHVPVGDVPRAREVAARCADAGIECPSYGTYLGADQGSGSTADACATASALGADNLRVWTPLGTDHTADPETRGEIVRELSTTSAIAVDHGLTVGVEFHGWTLTHTAESTLQLIDEVGAPNFYTYWQPVYWDETINDDPVAQVAEFDAVSEHLAHLHVYWWRGLTRHPLVDGEATWSEVLPRARGTSRWEKPRYAFLEFLPDDEPSLLAREAATLTKWIA
ncbi:sugar phosphate isomerase/epimerase family protein [Ilumatobacter nonamiensis]|uniref:sugar phosphate isomerase/epimerase family protein n=1 Tax=Ilumatobacter nonamiensis TaxID=467093 RepID=UPI00034DA16D|nr:TIM barrel protein [Ilumatobacter nonamiensis]